MFDTPKVNFIIFSKDRAAQLSLLLESIDKLGWRKHFYTKVIYLSSNQEYEKGYELCRKIYPWVNYQSERGPEDYKPGYKNEAGLQSELNMAMLTLRNIPFQCLSTDDMVFYRTSNGDLNNVLESLPENGVFSLRLGFNTIVQDYHLQSKQPCLHKYVDKGDYIAWNPNDYNAYMNYGYPLAVDCHVLRTEKMRDLCKRFTWKTTNELESGWQKYRHEITELCSFKQSVALNIPCNSISGITRAGEKYPYDTRILNDNFLAGRKLSLENIMKHEIIGCHQEIELTYEGK